MAEAEKLKTEAWTHRVNRRKQRVRGEELAENDAPAQQTAAADSEPEVTGGSEPTDSVSGKPESSDATVKER